ncbi:MAG: amino acid racemase [Bacillota bacterium]|nr:amino acid racemase [Bacillota bacterium]
MRRKAVGILGGMGPEATADLFSKIVRSTPARRDQDHLRVIVDSLPQIPDRTAAILGQGESPGPVLRAAARRLESWGAEVIVIPCNTAHYYHGDIAAAVSVPVLHIMEQTARAITSAHPEVRKVGILASTGTLNAGLYRRALEAVGLTELCPPPDVQEDVMAAIYGVKAGEYDRPHRLLAAAAARLVQLGAGAVVAGCTEVPIALSEADVTVPFVDATLALARAAVRYAIGEDEPR